MSITKNIRKLEYMFDTRMEKYIWHHPLAGFFLVFVGMPLFVLLCVCISTIAIAFPMVWLLGWL